MTDLHGHVVSLAPRWLDRRRETSAAARILRQWEVRPQDRAANASGNEDRGGELVLQDLGNAGQALAALIAVIGIPLAVRQLSIQNQISRLDILRDLETKWAHRTDQFLQDHPSDAPMLSAATSATVSDKFVELAVRPAFPGRTVTGPFPRHLMALMPNLADLQATTRPGGPRDEAEYEEELIARCRTTFAILDHLAASGDGAHRADLKKLLHTVYRFTAALSDVAELFDFGLADPERFMEKRHLAVARDLHVLEPFLLWQAIRTTDHRSVRAMRALALGASARSYTWHTHLHQETPISIRADSQDHMERSTYGSILQSGSRARFAPSLLQRRRLRREVRQPFRDHAKRSQNNLMDRIAAEDPTPS